MIKRSRQMLLLMTLVAFIVVSTVGATAAHADNKKDKEFISLSWGKGKFSTVTTEPFTEPAKIAPGSHDQSTLKIRNDGPAEGMLKVWIMDVQTTPSKDAPFFDEINAEWSGPAGTGATSFRQLASTNETLIGSMKIKKGQVVPLTVGYDYPVGKNNMNVPGSNSKGSFKVRVQISGEYDVKEALTVTLIPHHNDKNGDGKINVGESIKWQFVIVNEGNTTISNIEVISKYLSGRGVKIVCEKTTLAPGENTSCWAESVVTKEDARNGKIKLDYTVKGFTPDGETYQMFSGVLNITVEKLKNDVIEPGTPTVPTVTVKPSNPSSTNPPGEKRLTCSSIGKSNIQSTDPDYRVYLDRNKNGVACERKMKIPGGVMDAMTNPAVIAGGVALITIGAIFGFIAWRKRNTKQQKVDSPTEKI